MQGRFKVLRFIPGRIINLKLPPVRISVLIIRYASVGLMPALLLFSISTKLFPSWGVKAWLDRVLQRGLTGQFTYRLPY